MHSTPLSSHSIELLKAAKIESFGSLMDLNPDQLASSGLKFMITDHDGVIAPYGEQPTEDMLQKISDLADALPNGLAIVTNNWNITGDSFSEKISLQRAYADKPWNLKPFPLGVKQALRDCGALPEDTIAIGDGCTDLIAFKLAGIGRVGMVGSLGPHPMQDFVHRNLYRPAAPLGAAMLRGLKLL